jgi:hypothetical protein
MRGLLKVVSRFCVLLALLFSVQCAVLLFEALEPQMDKSDANDRIEKIKTWLPNSEFVGVYKITSEDALRKTIMFVENPHAYFYQIEVLDMTQFWDNIRIYDAFMYDKKKAKSRFYFHERLSDIYAVGFWHEVKQVDISPMTFLLLNCPSGDYAGLIKDLYLKTFDSYWYSFIPQLKKRADWKRIADEFGAERTEQIRKVMKHLKKSKFERELREYLVIRYPTLGDSVQKSDAPRE